MPRGRVATDISGQRFGRWTVLHRVEPLRTSGAARWLCVCDCGTERTVAGNRLQKGEAKSCGCYSAELLGQWRAHNPAPNAIDLAGQRFGRLLVLARDPIRHRYVGGGRALKWQCVCDCGREVSVLVGSLRNGNSTSCGRFRCRSRTKPAGMAMAWVTYKRYRKNAATRGLSFKITFEQFVALTKQSCAYCGDEPKQETFRLGSHGAYVYNGLDRIDNVLGYSITNVVPCCKSCNFFKGILPVAEFLGRCRRITEWQQTSALHVVA